MFDKLSLALKETEEFRQWYLSLSDIEKTKVDARLDNMKYGFFAKSRRLGEGLFEVKWKNGMRVYYSRKRIDGADVIALWGGFKGSQKKDIDKARRIKRRYENEFKEKKVKGKAKDPSS